MRKGFTLLELVIVIIIVAVLAGLGIPQFMKTVERAKSAEGVATLGTLRSSQLRYYAEWNTYTSTIANLDVAAPASLKNFAAPTATNPGAAGSVVNIVRTGSSPYTIYISDTGNLTCTPAANCPAGITAF